MTTDLHKILPTSLLVIHLVTRLIWYKGDGVGLFKYNVLIVDDDLRTEFSWALILTPVFLRYDVERTVGMEFSCLWERKMPWFRRLQLRQRQDCWTLETIKFKKIRGPSKGQIRKGLKFPLYISYISPEELFWLTWQMNILFVLLLFFICESSWYCLLGVHICHT